MSKRETIVQAVIAALAGTTGVSTRIFRSRIAALAAAEVPALLIECENDIADRANLARLIWNLTFAVRVITRSGEVDASADPIIADVHSRIMNDATLNLLCVDLMPISVEWAISGEKGTEPTGVADVKFRASYQTDNLNLN